MGVEVTAGIWYDGLMKARKSDLLIAEDQYFHTEIAVKHFRLIEVASRDMEAHGVDVSEYHVQMRFEDKLLHLRFHRPDLRPDLASWEWRGSPPGGRVCNYWVCIATGDIVKIQEER